MNKFRKLGFIEYNGKLEVHNSLLNVVLYDKPEIKTRDAGASTYNSVFDSDDRAGVFWHPGTADWPGTREPSEQFYTDATRPSA